MLSYGMVCNGMLWYGAVWNGIWHGTKPYIRQKVAGLFSHLVMATR